MQVVVDTILTNYTRIGQGKKLLFLHGWGDRGSTFDGLTRQLSKDFECISLDLPGFGGTALPPEPWDLSDYAHFVMHFLQKIDAGSVYALIGHSNGGAVAVELVSDGKLKADKLVLLASAGIRQPTSAKKRVLRWITKLGKVITLPLPTAAKQNIRVRLYNRAGSDYLVVPALQETFKKVVSQDIRPQLPAVSIPVLLLYGEMDTATPPVFGEQFAELLSESELIVLPNAGHFIHHDREADVITHMRSFFA